MATEPEPVAQEILAWRGWRLGEGEMVLRSMNWEVTWDGPTLVADRVPDADHQHGIYALNDPNGYPPHQLSGSLMYFIPAMSYRTMAEVWGEVALSGVVVVGENGYRAERATIRSLLIREERARWKDVPVLTLIAALEERYQCPVDWECSKIQALP